MRLCHVACNGACNTGTRHTKSVRGSNGWSWIFSSPFRNSDFMIIRILCSTPLPIRGIAAHSKAMIHPHLALVVGTTIWNSTNYVIIIVVVLMMTVVCVKTFQTLTKDARVVLSAAEIPFKPCTCHSPQFP